GFLRAAQALRPNNRSVSWNLMVSHLKLGHAFRQQKKLADAELAFREAVRLKPDDAECQNNLGTVLAADTGRMDEAIKCFLEAIRVDNKFTLAYHNLGLAWRIKGRL